MINEKQDSHLSELGDEILWEEVRGGNKSSFGEIYKRYFDELFRYGMTILPDKFQIGDAIQELFIDLWAYRKNLSSVKQLKYYLLKSIRSKIYRKIEASHKKTLREIEYKKHQIEYLSSAEDELIQSDINYNKTMKMKALINSLPELQREAIMLVFFEGKSYEEASTIMSKNIQAVYTLVSRAVTQLKKQLGS